MRLNNSILYLFLLFIIGCGSNHQSNDDITTFNKPSENPILSADSKLIFYCPIKKEKVQWAKADVFNPGAIIRNGMVYLLIRCEDNPEAVLGGRTSRIGLAYSKDGIHFTKHPTPVLYPDSSEFLQYDYPGGCEDPRVVETLDGLYVMSYTSWNQDVARLSIAFSKDLIHWEKKGPAFAKAHDGRFLDYWSKSGSIITKMDGNRQVVTKIDGKYWMYWGEKFINLAWSENLFDWYPSIDKDGELEAVVEPRIKKFDSHLTECGPPAIIMGDGIVLFYNGKNADTEDADPELPRGTYSVGKLVFDKNNPKKVISRSDSYLLKPTLPHEITGQYKSGTTFAEGLVFFQSKWFMYYGTADSYVGVAISE